MISFSRNSKNTLRVEAIEGVGTTTTYMAEAVPGSLESQSVWQIQKIVETVVGGTTTTTITYPNGDNRYWFIWNNRATYDYL